jgi:hypothetical protein
VAISMIRNNISRRIRETYNISRILYTGQPEKYGDSYNYLPDSRRQCSGS